MTRRQPLVWRLVVSALLVTLWLIALYAAKLGVPFGVRLSPSGISRDQGFAYSANIPSPPLSALFHRTTDGMGQPFASQVQLFEDARPLGPNHSQHSLIRASGQGGFSDWQGRLYFSSSDNTDPRSNSRIYALQDRAYLHLKVYRWVAWIAGLGLAALWVQNLVFGQTARARRALAAPTQPAARRARNSAGVLTLLTVTCAVVSSFLSGAPFWIAAFSSLLFGLLGLRQLLLLAGLMRGASWALTWLLNVTLTVTAVGICVVAFEGYLAWLELSAVRGQRPEGTSVPASGTVSSEAARPVHVKEPDAPGPIDSAARPPSIQLPPELIDEIARRRRLLSLPAEWEWKPIEVPGATRAFVWHGVTHVLDDNNFRRLNGPYPKKRADIMRVMVVGDSMTYGDGIREEWTYTAQLGRAMSNDYRIEFFNLGADGHQSEDIARVIERMLPELQPDLVIYGVCVNDFLPSGVRQYSREYRFPLPQQLKQLLLARTRVARFLSDNYQSTLLRLGFSMDFYDDILKDLKGYQKRFAADVKRMNNFVRSHGLPPILGMTLDQFVEVGGRGYRISRIAEELMREAGFDVISMEGYYQRHDGSRFVVSRWEGHPDEEAYMLFASILYDNLSRRPDVQRFVLKNGAGPRRLQAKDMRTHP